MGFFAHRYRMSAAARFRREWMSSDPAVPAVPGARRPAVSRWAALFAEKAPPESFNAVSAVFHYLGPAFAVLLFARVDVLGVAWLRIASAALIFAALAAAVAGLRGARSRRQRAADRVGRGARGDELLLLPAIDRLPLGTVAAIEFLPVIVLAALGARTRRNACALAFAVGGVYLLTDVVSPASRSVWHSRSPTRCCSRSTSCLARPVAKRGAVGGIDGPWLSRCSLPPWSSRRSGAGPRRRRSPTRSRCCRDRCRCVVLGHPLRRPTSSRWPACRVRPTR